jgi:hypothetical protein
MRDMLLQYEICVMIMNYGSGSEKLRIMGHQTCRHVS